PTGCRTLPCLGTASAWAPTSHRPGARSGAHTLAAETTGFLTLVLLARVFAAFPKDWNRSRLSLRSNTRESARWSITSVADQMFFDASSGRAIFPDKSISSCERHGFPI